MRLFTTLVGTGAALALCTGTAAAQTAFGSSCAGASGVTPTLDVTGTVASGQFWNVEITSPGGIGLEYIAMGFSKTTATALGGIPLPFDLGLLFSDPLWAGCPLNVDFNFALAVNTFNPLVAGGVHQWPLGNPSFPLGFPGFDMGKVFVQVVNVDADFITRIAGVSQGMEVVPTPPMGPQPGDLVITEIMKDPSFVGDNAGEWFEILNTTAAPIDIEGWTIKDDGSDSHVIANGGSGVIVPANSYFVLGNNGDSLTNGGVNVDYVYSGISMGNSDDEIVLVEPVGSTEIARVNYDNGITFPDSAGISFALDVAFLNETDNDNGANWADSTCFLPNPSTDKGTPGIANDQCFVTPPGPGSGELIITEVMYDPAVVGDVYGEWFEVYNTTGSAIDMIGYEIKQGANSFTVSSSLVVPAGGFATFLRNGDSTQNGGIDPVLVNGYDYASAIFLGNSGATLEIFDGINKLTSLDYGAVNFPSANGRSIILDPTVTQNLTNSLDGTNWCFSATTSYTGDGLDDSNAVVTGVTQFGTPGATNDTCPIIPTGVPTGELVITEVMTNGIDETTDQQWFELFNTTGSAIDIDGYILTDSGTGYHIVNNGGPLLVPAGGRITLGASNDTLVNGGYTHDYAYSGVFLSNFADSIVVATSGGAIVSQIDYNGSLGWPVANPGHTLILDPTLGITHANSIVGTNWCKSYFTTFGTAGQYGTPSAANDTCPILPSGSPTGELIITEILQNGASALDTEEFFEIYNTTGAGIDIDGYIIADLGSDYHIIDNGGPLVVPAGGYITLGTSGDTIVNGGYAHDYVYGKDMFLSNGLDEIVLATAAGAIVCEVDYDDGSTYPADAAAQSMILDPTAGLTQSASANGANWCISSSTYGDTTNFGTPGAANDSCGGGVSNTANPGDVLVTEVMQNPAAVADSAGEYFELYNTTANPIDVNGWVFTDNGSNTFTVNNGGPLVIAPGGYLLFANNGNTATNGGLPTVDYVFPGSYALGNSADAIIVSDTASTEITRVEWDNGVLWPDPNGASMNLDANSFNSTDQNDGLKWCETSSSSVISGGDFGTPGAANEICP